LYVCDGHAPVYRAYGIVMLTLAGDRISAITRFVDNSLMSWFGLPSSLAE
jgi:RNA polymerase sigma-70 factor (ECF subfamily)